MLVIRSVVASFTVVEHQVRGPGRPVVRTLGDQMDSPPHVRPSVPGGRVREAGGGGVVQELPAEVGDQADRGDADAPGHQGQAVVEWLLSYEPPSGFWVRARQNDHHSAGDVFHRDDREGAQGANWWWHDGNEWLSWDQITALATKEKMVLEPMFSIPARLGCPPDGPHGAACASGK